MAHHIYHTEGFVLSRTNTGEWDARVALFTKDLGLIFVQVKGYRRPVSKLRPHLMLFAHVRVSVVRGRETWKLIFAENSGLMGLITKNRSTRLVVGQIINVIKRLVKGEEAHPALFEELLAGFKNINQTLMDGTDGQIEKIELVTLLRILHHLGYVPDVPELRIFIDGFSWEQEIAIPSDLIRRSIVETINTSLQATHL